MCLHPSKFTHFDSMLWFKHHPPTVLVQYVPLNMTKFTGFCFGWPLKRTKAGDTSSSAHTHTHRHTQGLSHNQSVKDRDWRLQRWSVSQAFIHLKLSCTLSRFIVKLSHPDLQSCKPPRNFTSSGLLAGPIVVQNPVSAAFPPWGTFSRETQKFHRLNVVLLLFFFSYLDH